mgnify:CR=1 FL=1
MIGILLLVVGLGVLGFGLMNHLKGKRILAAPFKKTGELLKDPTSPDAKGAISTEGKMVAPAQALLAPCSATPCAYYEVKIERLFEKTETTQDGTKTVKGSETLETLKNGAVIGLDDGSGAFNVDLSKGADFDAMKEGFKKEVAGHSRIPSLTFGNFVYSVKPISEKDSWTIGFKVTEKYVPVEGSLFVLGKLEGNSIVKPGWRSMMASSKGREGLLGSVSKRKKFSLIGGGVTAVAAIALMAFGPKGSTSLESSDACHFDIAGVQSVYAQTLELDALVRMQTPQVESVVVAGLTPIVVLAAQKYGGPAAIGRVDEIRINNNIGTFGIPAGTIVRLVGTTVTPPTYS